MRTHALLAASVLLSALFMYIGPGLLSVLGSPEWRRRAMNALHATHFDHNVRPNRETRRSMHVRLGGLWMLADERGSVTLPTFTGRTMKDRLADMRPIAGGDVLDTTEPVKLEDLAGLSVETLRERQSATLARAESLIEEQAGEFSRERHKEIKLRTQDLVTYKEAIAEREGDTEAIAEIKRMREAEDARKQALRTQSKPEIYGREGELTVVEFKTPGEFFTSSDQYADFLKRGAKGDSDVVPYQEASKLMGLRTGTDKLKARAPITGADASGGTLVRPQFLGLQEPGLTRPLTIRDLVTVLPTDSDAIEYVKEDTRASNAATVSEADQLAHTGDETATKPEGGLTFAIVTDTVKIIAEWVAVTTKILQDAPQLRAYIDEYLLYDLALELEDQMVAGDGLGENFTGILNTAGIQTVAAYAAGSGPLENIRKGITLVEKNGRTRPTAVVVSPEDSQMLDLLKVNDEANHFAGSGPWAYSENQPIWGRPRVVSEAQPTGTALVGDFRRAVLYDRQQTQISVGTVGDDFIRNLRRVLAEGRYGFGVRRPKAFCEVDLTAAP